MKIAIIIINYNKYEKTIECIETIKESKFTDYKIYLLDNNSLNESYKILEEKYCNEDFIEIISLKENIRLCQRK